MKVTSRPPSGGSNHHHHHHHHHHHNTHKQTCTQTHTTHHAGRGSYSCTPSSHHSTSHQDPAPNEQATQNQCHLANFCRSISRLLADHSSTLGTAMPTFSLQPSPGCSIRHHRARSGQRQQPAATVTTVTKKRQQQQQSLCAWWVSGGGLQLCGVDPTQGRDALRGFVTVVWIQIRHVVMGSTTRRIVWVLGKSNYGDTHTHTHTYTHKGTFTHSGKDALVLAYSCVHVPQSTPWESSITGSSTDTHRILM